MQAIGKVIKVLDAIILIGLTMAGLSIGVMALLLFSDGYIWQGLAVGLLSIAILGVSKYLKGNVLLKHGERIDV